MSRLEKLTSSADFERALERSGEHPVFVFKHSLTCPISGTALREYESFVASRGETEEVAFSLIEIQNARDVSKDVAERTGVRHESPQALLLVNREVAWHASHWSIKEPALATALGSALSENG